jgi:hypothetical protein
MLRHRGTLTDSSQRAPSRSLDYSQRASRDGAPAGFQTLSVVDCFTRELRAFVCLRTGAPSLACRARDGHGCSGWREYWRGRCSCGCLGRCSYGCLEPVAPVPVTSLFACLQKQACPLTASPLAPSLALSLSLSLSTHTCTRLCTHTGVQKAVRQGNRDLERRGVSVAACAGDRRV